MSNLTLADLASPGERLTLDELHERASLLKSWEDRQRQAKTLRRRKDLDYDEEAEAAEDAAAGTENYTTKEEDGDADAFDPTARAARLKELRHRYRSRPKRLPGKSKAKSATRTRTGTKSHCACNGSCGDCQFDQCHRLGQRLQELDAALAVTHQQLQIGDLTRLTKSLLGTIGADATAPSNQDVNTVLAKLKMFTLRTEREAVWDKMCATGCSILRADRASAS
jgi:hypothetical protein